MANCNDLRSITAGFTALYIMLATGCGGSGAGKFQPHAFPVPDVPAMVTSMEDAKEYFILNYWNEFTDTSALYPCDSAVVNGVLKEEVEQALADWLAFVGSASPELSEKSMAVLFDRISACEARDTASTVFETVSSLIEKYLYDPNSPLRNEDLYLPFATRMASCRLVAPARREAYGYDAGMCSLNRTGTPAADFSFSDKDGRIRTLYSLNADFTLLFFSNPGCEACKYIIDELKSDPVLESMVSSGKVAVANIYIDEDIESWYGYQSIYPKEWYNGYDPNFIIRTDLLYNVRAIPSLYLLDRDKKVILKDAPDIRVFSYLHGIAEQ